MEVWLCLWVRTDLTGTGPIRWSPLIFGVHQPGNFLPPLYSLRILQITAPQQTREPPPMPDQCWHTVADGVPTLSRHWLKVPCSSRATSYLARGRGKHPANTGNSHNAVSMLAHRLQRWLSIETTLCECPVFAGKGPATALRLHFRKYLIEFQLLFRTFQHTSDGESTLFQFCVTVCDAGPPLTPHWVNVLCLWGSSHTSAYFDQIVPSYFVTAGGSSISLCAILDNGGNLVWHKIARYTGHSVF